MASDESVLDFSSAFEFASSSSSSKNKSVFTYNKKGARSSLPYDTLQSSDVVGSRGGQSQVVISYVVAFFGYIFVLMTMPFSLFFALRFVSEKERLVLFRLGRFWSVKGPGTIVTIPFIDKSEKVDLRSKSFMIPPMFVMLADGGSISVGATVMYAIRDAVTVTLTLQNVNHTIRTLGQAVLFHVLNKYTLDQIRRDKSGTISHTLKDELNDSVFEWGLEISNIEMSHVTEISAPLSAFEEVREQLGPMLNELGGMNMVGAMFQHFAESGQPNKSNQKAVTSGDWNDLKSANQNDDALLMNLQLKITNMVTEDLVDQISRVYCFDVILGGGDSEVKDRQSFILDLKHKPGGIYKGSQIIGNVSWDAKITITMHDLQLLLSGELSKFSAYMSGRVEIEGDTTALYALQPLEEKLLSVI